VPAGEFLMSIDLPLTVRLKTRRKDVDVTTQLADLSFRSSIPGGFASLTMSLNRPLDLAPDEIEYFGSVYVYDARNGRTIWEGRMEDPGRGTGDLGEVFSLTAVGSRAHTKDRVFPVIYVDRSLDRWRRSRYTFNGSAQTQIGEIDEDTPAIVMSATEGATITTAWAADMIYRSIYWCGQLVARIRADHIGDGTSSNYHAAMFARTGSGSATFSDQNNWAVTQQTLGANINTVGWDQTTNVVSFRIQRDNSNTVADQFTTVYFYNVVVRAVIKKLDGTDNLSAVGYNVNNIDPNEVVTDLLGRVLNKFDAINATIVGSGIDIDQLAYPDGTTADAILEELQLYDPGFYWAAWESNPANGLARFEYVPWPSIVRYDATTEDGFDSPASGSDLYNRVRVRWLDPGYFIRHTVRTQTVQELTDAGLTREAYIDISDEMGAPLMAQYIGDNFLLEHRFPPNAGTLRIGRPIVDNLTGRVVQPWEILPGHLIRVRGVQPRVDALNPTARDGVTVFRVISVDFSTADGTATLELDSYVRTISRKIAELDRMRLDAATSKARRR
jgi:hypothetical protein